MPNKIDTLNHFEEINIHSEAGHLKSLKVYLTPEEVKYFAQLDLPGYIPPNRPDLLAEFKEESMDALLEKREIPHYLHPLWNDTVASVAYNGYTLLEESLKEPINIYEKEFDVMVEVEGEDQIVNVGSKKVFTLGLHVYAEICRRLGIIPVAFYGKETSQVLIDFNYITKRKNRH